MRFVLDIRTKESKQKENLDVMQTIVLKFIQKLVMLCDFCANTKTFFLTFFHLCISDQLMKAVYESVFSTTSQSSKVVLLEILFIYLNKLSKQSLKTVLCENEPNKFCLILVKQID